MVMGCLGVDGYSSEISWVGTGSGCASRAAGDGRGAGRVNLCECQAKHLLGRTAGSLMGVFGCGWGPGALSRQKLVCSL